MVTGIDGAADVAEAFLLLSYAEVLIEGCITLDGRLVDPLAATNIIGGAIALKAAHVLAAATARWVIGAIAFDYVIFHEWVGGPAIKREVGALRVVHAVITLVINTLRPPGFQPLPPTQLLVLLSHWEA